MKTNFIILFLFLITSSAYTRSKFCPEAELSGEQKAQVKELRKNFKANKEGLNREEKRAAWADLQQSILNDIAISEEQQAALSECFDSRKKRRHYCPEAELSEEQKAQVKELRKNFKANKEGLNREEKRAAWADLQQSILNDIATSEEQQAALSECFESRKKRKRKH